MADHLIECPECRRQLRVPEEVIGRLVRCPSCSAMFTVAAGGNLAAPATVRLPPVPSPAAAPAAYPPPAQPLAPELLAGDQATEELHLSREQAWAAVLPAAICLLLTGLLGLVVDGLLALLLATKPDLFDQPPAFGGPPPSPQLMAIIFLVFACISLVIVLAAVQMLRLRSYALAVAGCFLAMINFANLCCVFGLPCGIWAIVLLLREDVRSAFE